MGYFSGWSVDVHWAGHEPVRIGSNDFDRFEPTVEPGTVNLVQPDEPNRFMDSPKVDGTLMFHFPTESVGLR